VLGKIGSYLLFFSESEATEQKVSFKYSYYFLISKSLTIL